VKLLSQGSESEKAAAKASLIQLQGEGVSNAIATAVEDESPEVKIVLLQILTIRRAFDSIPTILNAALDDEASVRRAAMTALGKLASEQHIPGMVRGVLRAEKGSERAAAEKAVMFVCSRIADKDKRADPLLASMKKLNRTQYTTMLSTLGRLGGPRALGVVEHAIAENDPAQHSAGIRALSNWPDASVAPRLLELAKGDQHPADRTTCLRALIRVAPLPDGRTNLQRLELLQTAMKMASRDAEKTLVLQRAKAIRIPETLRFVVPYLDQPKFAQQACETIVELAHHRSLREPNKAEFERALDKVIATSNNATVIERANRYKKGQTWARPTSSNRK